MGKISSSYTKEKARHNPLYKDINSSDGLLKVQRSGLTSAKSEIHGDDGFLDARASRKILQLAREQQEELKNEEMQALGEDKPTFIPSEIASSSEDEESDDYEAYSDLEEVQLDGDDIEDSDQKMFDGFLTNTQSLFNLADKILAKIREKEMDVMTNDSQIQPQSAVLLPPKVIAAYEKIGLILSTYKHGKLPKLFKVLPTLKNWEDVLFVTNPDKWTSHATYEATKLFVSNLQANEAQKFVERVLLEKVRFAIEDSENHILDYHLYRAIKKALYKPGAFFKGFLLPLIDDHCTVREATIVGSVLAKVSVPVLHSSVALTQLVRRDFTPASIVFIRILIEKKYSLPYQTLDELVFYFMRFRNLALDDTVMKEEKDSSALPVVWHKAFLAFAQRYKNDITDDQRDFLVETVRQRFHHAIGPEIRRELLSGQSRLSDSKATEMSMESAF